MATATGMGGMFGYLGAAAFTLVFGVMVTRIGYSPLFVVLAIFDIVAAFIVWTVAREIKPKIVSGPAADQTLQPAS